MFETIGRTFELMKMSWAVLKKDRELILFPVMSGIALAILAALWFGVGSSIGTVDRMAADADPSGLDAALYVAAYFLLTFVIVYFNSALIGAAMIRLAGGDPTVGDGLRMANKRLPQILGWAVIAATVGLILQMLRNQSRNNILAQIVLSLIGGVWAYLTYFVVPIVVAEGLGPIAAIRSSGSLFKRTWGEQVTSNVGFGILGFVAALIGALPAVLVIQVNPVAGIAVGVLTIGLAVAIVTALEGIFKAALYGYVADGRVPEQFTRESLAGAYQYRGGGARPYRPY